MPTHNALGPKQPNIQLQHLPYPAPEMFAIFAMFANFIVMVDLVIATLTRGIPCRWA